MAPEPPDILTLPDLSERPRTMAENHEVLVVAVGGLAEDDVAVVADDESEGTEEREGFIT